MNESCIPCQRAGTSASVTWTCPSCLSRLRCQWLTHRRRLEQSAFFLALCDLDRVLRLHVVGLKRASHGQLFQSFVCIDWLAGLAFFALELRLFGAFLAVRIRRDLLEDRELP